MGELFVDPPEGQADWGGDIYAVGGVLTHKTVNDAIEKMKTIDLKARAEAEERQLALYRWLVEEGKRSEQ